MADPWLIAGLGNPGERYADTRHNAGAMAVQRLANRLGVHLRKVRFLAASAAEARHGDHSMLLALPLTFMNESGPPLASFARKRGVPADRMVVCHDEIDLPFGAIRVKRGGSTAGHHGLESLVGALRSTEFFRVRIGIGRPPGRWQNVDFLLAPFSAREREEAAVLVEEAAEAALSLVTEGLPATQDRYNRSGTREG